MMDRRFAKAGAPIGAFSGCQAAWRGLKRTPELQPRRDTRPQAAAPSHVRPPDRRFGDVGASIWAFSVWPGLSALNTRWIACPRTCAGAAPGMLPISSWVAVAFAEDRYIETAESEDNETVV
jgi:hypothetical protein